MLADYCLFRVVLVVFVPLLQNLLPVNDFAVSNSFGLLHGFVVQPLLGVAQLHCLYCGIVEYVYTSAAQALVKVGGAKCLALYVEVGYIELKNRAQCVAHHLLLCAVASQLASKQFAYDIELLLREFLSSHSVCFVFAVVKVAVFRKTANK